MLKKLLSLSLVALIATTLFGCTEQITLEVSKNTYTIKEGEDVSITITSNETKGFVIGVEDTTIISYVEDEDTKTITVTGLKEGETTLSVASKTSPANFVDITITVRKNIEITYEHTSLELDVDEEYTVTPTSNDTDLEFISTNTSVFVVDENGMITAKEEGTAYLTIKSTYDPLVELSIQVNVEKIEEISVEQSDYVMVVGDTNNIVVTSNDTYTFESRNPDIATVSETGEIEAVKFGVATIRVISDSKPDIYEEITVTVFKFTTGLTITGNNILIVGMEGTLEVNPDPVGAYEEVEWTTSDESIITVDDNGVVTGVSVGTASVIAKSVLDTEVLDTYEIEVIDVVLVDATKQSGDTYTYEGVELEYGVKLFSTITEALTAATEGTRIYVETGTYTEDVTVSINNLSLEAIGDAVYIGTLIISSDDVIIDGFTFEGNSSVKATSVTNFTFINNTANNITTVNPFLSILGTVGSVVTDNTLTIPDSIDAIEIENFLGGDYIIKRNTISGALRGIVVDATTEYDITTSFNIERNIIDSVGTAFDIDLVSDAGVKSIEAYGRFNEVTNYATGVETNTDSIIDFTLNYWGVTELDMNKFSNMTADMLRGFYTDNEDIISEEDYDPRIPIIIEIVNPITEIMIGETHTFEYSVLPMDMINPYIRFLTSNPSVLGISNAGEITPKVSGVSTITVRSGYTSKVNTTIEIEVITTPGVELSSDHIYNNLIVGDTFKLTASAFPAGSSSEPITFSSSNNSIATIDSSGNVTTLSEGLVTFKAEFTNDATVYTEYTIYVYSSLDENDLLDYLTMNQLSYSTPHEWTAFGYQGNYVDNRYESVSRYYFSDTLPINTTKMVPVAYMIRPGEPMDTLSEAIRFNEENIHWVVVHDTGSTAFGSNAEAHANYLWNLATYGSDRWVSWHYSIDSEYIYQHLPEHERGYHAGDGSNQVGQGSYLGGGNRNGVGIEMAINEDGDMMRTWQRTAKLVVDILTRNNMPLSQARYHNDFSGKNCPQTLREAGLIPMFEEFLAIEYRIKTEFADADITFTSNNPDYLDNNGRVIQMPDRAMTVSYTITVTENGVTSSRTFYTYLPGTVH